MIMADKNGATIVFQGSVPDFLTEVTMLMRDVRKVLSEVIGVEIADELLDQAIRLLKMSENDLEEEAARLKCLFGGGDTNPGSVEEDKKDGNV